MSGRLISRAAAAAAVAIPLAVFGMGPAQAAPQCPGPSSHPDKFSAGGFKFKDGAQINTGPAGACTTVGLGYATHGVDVHCWVVNSAGNVWWYTRDTTTGKDGWVYENDFIHGDYLPTTRC